MLSQYKWVDFRALLGLVVVFGACGYEPPAAVDLTSSSSSSGMGGAGGTESSSSSSSSSGGGGKGGGGLSDVDGGLPDVDGGLPDVDGGLPGVDGGGGAGGGNSTGGTGGSGGSPDAMAVVEDCGGVDCKIEGLTVCCMSKTTPNDGSCHEVALCGLTLKYALKCDDKADCGANEYCCLDFGAASCKEQCGGNIVCKGNEDCPMPQVCDVKDGSLTFCGP